MLDETPARPPVRLPASPEQARPAGRLATRRAATGRRPVPRRAPSRGALVTAAGPRMRAALHDLALPTFAAYARAWDWTLVVEDLPDDGAGADDAAQSAKWAKVRLLRAALAEHRHALWLDADVLLQRTDEDVLEHLHPHDFQALALEQVPAEHRVNPNTGVWLLRAGPQADAFLDAVERAGRQPGPWSDQGAVLHALGWDRGDERYHWARPGVGNVFSGSTSWLPPGWNSPYTGRRSDDDCFNSAAASYADRPRVEAPHALHFMGMTPAARYRAMAEERARAGLSPARARARAQA